MTVANCKPPQLNEHMGRNFRDVDYINLKKLLFENYVTYLKFLEKLY
jgi:hypothetical protein